MKHFSKVSDRSNRDLFRFRGEAPVAVFYRLPELRGRKIDVSYLPELTAWRGQLLSRSHKGDAVYAGCFLRKRKIVLDENIRQTGEYKIPVRLHREVTVEVTVNVVAES